MNELLKHVGVFPELEQMLCSFGVKKFAMDEAFSACELLLHGGENEAEVLGTICCPILSFSTFTMIDSHTQKLVAY